MTDTSQYVRFMTCFGCEAGFNLADVKLSLVKERTQTRVAVGGFNCPWIYYKTFPYEISIKSAGA
jgi:hypothetical protein